MGKNERQMMDKSAGRGKRILYVIMTLWGGIGIVRWLAGGLPVHHGSAYGAGQNTATVVLFLMFGCGIYGLWRLWKAQKDGGKKSS
jgi:hypothetical protein